VGDAKGNATVYKEVADKYGSTVPVIKHVRISHCTTMHA